MYALPEDSVSAILSYTSPAEASRYSVVSSTFPSASVSHRFLPSDYDDTGSRALIPLIFSSRKDLFFALSRLPVIDGGNKISGDGGSQNSELAGNRRQNQNRKLITKHLVSERAYGLESAASKVSVRVGIQVKSGRAYLWHEPEKTHKINKLFYRDERGI